jgi:sortase A
MRLLTARARRSAILALIGALVAFGCASLGHALHIRAKAELGQLLLERAWARTQRDGAPARPWPWADTHPVARLAVPARGVDLLVLAGASGRTLAWGPGHLDDSAPVGGDGNAVLSAHRDTHFRFLRDVASGERLVVELPGGTRRAYRVRGAAIVDARALRLTRHAPTPLLTLVTCYPFDAIAPGGPLRYVVTAEAE